MNTVSRNTFNLTLKTLFIAAPLVMRLFVAPLPALASDVLIIKDSDIQPYQEAIQGFQKTCSCSVREMDLSDLEAIEMAVKAKPDAVVALGTQALRRTKMIRNVPLIYAMVMPSESAEATGENVSGVSMDIAPAVYLAAMAGLFPDAKRIGVLFNPDQTGPFVREASVAAREKGISLVLKPVLEPREAPALLNELRGTIDVMWMLPDATIMNSEMINAMLLFSFQQSVPVFSFSKKYVEMGAVAALTIDPLSIGKQAGEMARGLLQDGKGPLRAYARNPRLIVNSKVGAKLGVRINGELIRNAEKVE
jgi:putative ABC transport system substrate-binding protein